MIATITTRMMKEDKVDEWVELAQKMMIPTIQDVDGLLGGGILVDHRNSTIIHIIFWDSEEAAIAAENSQRFQDWNKEFEKLQIDKPLLEYFDASLLHGNISAYAGVR